MKYIIKIWKGRGFLHRRYKIGKFVIEGDQPLGSDPKYIKKTKDFYKCKIVFLNDDFSLAK